MFHRVQFPAEAVTDILEVASLSANQLDSLNRIMNSAASVEPVEPSFVGIAAAEIGVSEEIADQLLRVGVVLKRLELDAEVAVEVVDDMVEAVRQHADVNSRDAAIQNMEANRERLVMLTMRSETRKRVLRRRQIQQGTQPTIQEIRTLVQLRPLFTEDESSNPIAIECMIPAMTLELKFRRDKGRQSATFSLDRETLHDLIQALERARIKWDLMNDKYSSDICGEES